MIDTPEHFEDAAAIQAYEKRLHQLLGDNADRDHWFIFDVLMGEAATGPYPYWASEPARYHMLELIYDSFAASRLYQIWGELEDRFDLKLKERVEAVTNMRRAAAEWLALTGDPENRTEYLDRWYYDECGYRRDPS